MSTKIKMNKSTNYPELDFEFKYLKYIIRLIKIKYIKIVIFNYCYK